jgi:aspartyl/asparaginyl-tRNA synthetase
MGGKRPLQTITGAGNLRETTLFPRDIKRLALGGRPSRPAA